MSTAGNVRHLPRGIYRVRRGKLGGPGQHYGVLSVGVLAAGVAEVFDLGPEGFGRSSIEGWAHGKKVEVVDRCPDHEHEVALGRLRDAVEAGRGYHLWNNNCEHFATWVVVGAHRSAQVDGVADVLFVVGVTAAVGGIVLLVKAIGDE